jgi:N-acyl-phosphatidylethanolamine-hydrolysing phospholipase D
VTVRPRSPGRRGLLLALLVLPLLAGCAGVGTEPIPGKPAHHVDGGFRNTNPDFRRADGWTRLKFFVKRAWQSLVSPRTFDAPRESADGLAAGSALRSGPDPTITWIGHATLLIRLDGLTILTDPNWSERASPLSWAGPKRLSPPGLPFEGLPKVDVVVISHDHYDHLDLATVKRLAAEHDPRFVVPLGLKAWFADNGMTRVEERDWWERVEHRGVIFVCTPAQHFAQRTPWDGNRRLWATWAVIGPSRRLFFTGDTGYFDGFKEVGDRLGPFDLAAVAIGAYLPTAMMRSVHITPEEAIRVAEDVRARVMVGIHWGTFDVADEPLGEPPERMRADAARRGIPPERAWILRIGETRRW